MGGNARKGRQSVKEKEGSSRGASRLSSCSPGPPKKPRPVYPPQPPPPEPRPNSSSYAASTWPHETQYRSQQDYVQPFSENYQQQEYGQPYHQPQPGLRSRPYGQDQQSLETMYSSSYNSNHSWTTQSSNTSSGTAGQNQTSFANDQPGYTVSSSYQQQTSGPYGDYSAASWGYNQELPALSSSAHPSRASSRSQSRWKDTKKR